VIEKGSKIANSEGRMKGGLRSGGEGISESQDGK